MNEMQKARQMERMWGVLLSEIENGNVIPIIGDELFRVKINGETMHLNEYIIREIMTNVLGEECNKSLTYTDLAGDDYRHKWRKVGSDLYYETNRILKDMSDLRVQSSAALRKLLSIDKFKVVLTTSFDDWVFRAMEEKWGKGAVRELSYKKRSAKDDTDNFLLPLLYHIFGKADVVPHSFVLTEDDLLEFLHHWLNDNYRPKRLAAVLREKYLLVVGCNFPNWLFRFFIQSMKSSLVTSAEDKTGMVADSKLDDELVAFLSRINVQNHCNTEDFINELAERWSKRSPVGNSKVDIFISYASEDYETVAKIVRQLREWNINVWFDKLELEPGDEYGEKIRRQIQDSKIFVPILSHNTLVPGRRFFKKEWNWGLEEAHAMVGTEKYIYPIALDESIDVKSEFLPQKFKDENMINYYEDGFENDLKKLVRDIRK
jgi:TIR domain.